MYFTGESVQYSPKRTVDPRTERLARIDYRVPGDFRERLLERFPALRGNEPLADFARRLTQYFLFAHPDPETGEYGISWQLLARMAGRNPNGDRHGFSTRHLLDWFSSTVFPLRIRSYTFDPTGRDAGTCRLVVPLWGAMPGDAFSVKKDLHTLYVKYRYDRFIPKVFLVSGLPVSRRRHERAETETDAYFRWLAIDAPKGHPARTLIDYLNGQSPRTLKDLYAANGPAISRYLLDQLECATTEAEVDRVAYTSKIMNELEHNGFRSVYGPRAKTSRLYLDGYNIGQLPRPIRKLLLRGCVHVDLRAAQLTVFASVFESPKLAAFLQSKRNVWEYLMGEIGAPPDRKDIVKKTVYSVCYGMSEAGLKVLLAKGCHSRSDQVQGREATGIGWTRAVKFFQIPEIAELLEVRAEVLERIETEGGALDAFGSWIPMNGRDAKSILAAVGQSYEMSLMLPALTVLKESRSARVTVFLHDGFSVYWTEKDRQGLETERIVRAIDARAEELGIPTWAEVEG